MSFRSLLEEMTNRDALSRYPNPYYTFEQFSSYDRHTSGIKDSTWGANMDCSYFMREEEIDGRKESVFLH